MYDISTMHTVDTEKGDAHINVLSAMLVRQRTYFCRKRWKLKNRKE